MKKASRLVWMCFFLSYFLLLSAHSAEQTDTVKPEPNFYLGVDHRASNTPNYVFGDYPLDIGNVWTYKNIYKSEIHGTDAIITVTWTSEITIRERVEIAEGTMILRDFAVRDMTYDYPKDINDEDVRWFKENIGDPEAIHLLIFKSRYVIEVPEWGWDNAANTLTPEFRERMTQPDNPYDGDDLTYLAAGKLPTYPTGCGADMFEETEDIDVPFGHIEKATCIVHQYTNGAPRKWFKEGIGFVKESFRHSGSYFERESVLTQFKSGKPGAARDGHATKRAESSLNRGKSP